MKKVGLIIFVIGVLITIFTGVNYVTKEVVLDAGRLNVTRDVNHDFSWSPFFGIIILTIGVAIFVVGIRKDKGK